MFDIEKELDRLTIDIEVEDVDEIRPSTESARWDVVTENLARLGKQQFRSNQHVEYLSHRIDESIAEVQRLAQEAREQAEEYRRENTRLKEKAVKDARRLLSVIDLVDDIMTLARQQKDAGWINFLDRLTSKVLDVFEQVGITEIPSEGRSYNEDEHEVIEAVEDSARRSYEIIEVVSRGFRYNGRVLRRAQVITAR